MEEWIRSNFTIISQGWKVDSTTREDAFVFEFQGYQITKSIPDFIAKFNVSIPPTLESLKACDPEDKLGCHQYFDAWKEYGLIN